MKRLSKIFLSLALVLGSTNPVFAQDFLPDAIQNIFGLLGPDGSGATFFVTSRVQALLLIGLALLVLASVVYAAFAAFKYIRSQGDPGQVEEAGKAVKSIFLGLVVLLFAIVGIVLIFVFFGAEFIGTETYQVCLSAPNSQGCQACNAGSGDPVTPITGGFLTLDSAVGGPAQAIPGSGVDGAGGLIDNFETNRFLDAQDFNALLNVPTLQQNRQICSHCEYSYFRVQEGDITLAPGAAPVAYNLSDLDTECLE